MNRPACGNGTYASTPNSSRACLACLLRPVTPASAQNGFPSKPITMVVPFGAGGALDLIARVLADGLRNELGQTVIVDNKPGASGLLAMRLVAGAAPDGYTIILSSESNHILLPLLDSKFPLDVIEGVRSDFAVRPIPAHSDREEGFAGHVGQGAGRLSQGQSRQAVVRLVWRRHAGPHRRRIPEPGDPVEDGARAVSELAGRAE